MCPTFYTVSLRPDSSRLRLRQTDHDSKSSVTCYPNSGVPEWKRLGCNTQNRLIQVYVYYRGDPYTDTGVPLRTVNHSRWVLCVVTLTGPDVYRQVERRGRRSPDQRSRRDKIVKDTVVLPGVHTTGRPVGGRGHRRVTTFGTITLSSGRTK